ncbi:Rieske 2Fe-2S domain-containing protein [Paenarthrobacter sp. Z7-10]|uniref:Rieske 2Fe-2S domain-containing protein n=1 Tax=Paenarthrobacter sp. Z7-10 TaxID=2787635 RepID=UPI0022A9E2AA|nr:Rieske 2Fe-2S domain-containing protein [Paenarthrobacter sp. Z7-10]MCZ2402459.1 Rieske 2Fe-2S domain-containing protein [Paenarthrobacter sp. Z7-10]
MKTFAPLGFIDRLENAGGLDPLAGAVRDAVNKIVKPQWLRDVLHGVPLGHPLHPLMVQVPLGAWTSAAVLDALPGTGKASTALVALGLVTAGPSALAGYVDFSELHEQQQRVAVIHSSANLVAVGLYTGSLLQRLTGSPGRGKALGLLGLTVVMAGGWLGGHLAFRQAVGANHAEDVPHRIPAGWHSLAPFSELTTGKMERRLLGTVPLLVLRTQANEILVLADTCSHLSGPLSEGKQQTISGEQCVVCPWHESAFSLRSGEVVHGPATSPQPKFLTRVVDGQVEVCLPGAG